MTTPARVVRLDRRAPARGDQRREALLDALDHYLQESSLDAINVADVSRRAGVTRSAFYFYFESKAHAVAALMGATYDEVAAVTSPLVERAGDPRLRIESAIRGMVEVLGRHRHVYRAMLEARATNEMVRELWDRYRESFVQPVADLIGAERAAGHAPDGPDPVVLATVLLDLNDRALERLLTDQDVSPDVHLQTVLTIWLRSIYAVTPEPARKKGQQ